MRKDKLETLVWVLIYGGLLGASLGWFMLPRSDALGSTLMVAGGAGPLIPGSGGLRKFRWGISGRGKRGGLSPHYS